MLLSPEFCTFSFVGDLKKSLRNGGEGMKVNGSFPSSEQVWVWRKFGLVFLVYIPLDTSMCTSVLRNVQHTVKHKENAAYPQALIICPENNHAEITYGSGQPLSHTLIPGQACSCWNSGLCSAQLKMFGKAQAESGKSWCWGHTRFIQISRRSYGHSDINSKVCALTLSNRLYFDVLFMIFCVWWVVKGEDPEGSWASLDCCWTISFLTAAVRAEAVPHRVKAEHPPDCAWLHHLLLRSPICLPYNWSIAKAKLSKRCPSNDGNYMIN